MALNHLKNKGFFGFEARRPLPLRVENLENTRARARSGHPLFTNVIYGVQFRGVATRAERERAAG